MGPLQRPGDAGREADAEVGVTLEPRGECLAHREKEGEAARRRRGRQVEGIPVADEGKVLTASERRRERPGGQPSLAFRGLAGQGPENESRQLVLALVAEPLEEKAPLVDADEACPGGQLLGRRGEEPIPGEERGLGAPPGQLAADDDAGRHEEAGDERDRYDPDQEIGDEADRFPAEEQLEEVVAHHQHQHREGKQ